jgi:predicted transcriptional regulator
MPMVKKTVKAPAARPTKTMFAVRLDDAMRSALDKAAEDEGNTAAGLARLAIRDWLRERKYLK